MNDLQPVSKIRKLFRQIAVGIGSATLLAVMLVVAANAMLRHMFVVVPGTIEVVMVIITVTASMGLIVATLDRGHALVHLLVGRLDSNVASILRKFVDFLGCLLWLLIGLGGAWIIKDYWQQNEATVLIGIPLTPFRLLWLAACLTIAAFQFHSIFDDESRKADDT